MFKRVFLTYCTIFLLVVAALLGLALLWLVVHPRLEAPHWYMALALWVALMSLASLVVFAAVFKKLWIFKATARPIPLDQLREELLAINDVPGPVQVISKRKKIILTWRYNQEQWCELLSRLGITRVYELHCRFDPGSQTVFLTDRIRRADFIICPERIKLGFARIPMPFLRVRQGRLGTVSTYATTEAFEYDFHPREIKAPVMDTLLASGWNVQFRLF